MKNFMDPLLGLGSTLTFHNEVLDPHISDDQGHFAPIFDNIRVSKKDEVNPANLWFHRLLAKGPYFGRNRNVQFRPACLIDQGGSAFSVKERQGFHRIRHPVTEIDHTLSGGQPDACDLDAPPLSELHAPICRGWFLDWPFNRMRGMNEDQELK